MGALRIDTAVTVSGDYAIEARNLRIFYGDFLAVKDARLQQEIAFAWCLIRIA